MAGAVKICRTGPVSTMRPAYITATRSQMRETMPRLWVMKIMASPCVCWSSLRSLRYWAWMVRSRLVVGSSAISRRGGAAMAMAPTTRWRMPPESWWGKARSRSAGEGMRTEASSAVARSVSARPRSPWYIVTGSRTCIPMENTGLSELIGSCRIMPILRPRIRCISGSLLVSSSSPSRRTDPPTMRAAAAGRAGSS